MNDLHTKFLSQDWFLIEKLHKYPPLHLITPLIVSNKSFGVEPALRGIYEYQGILTNMYQIADEFKQAAEHSIQTLLDRPEWIDNLHHESNTILVPRIQELHRKIVHNTDIKSLTNIELVELFDELYDPMQRLHVIRAIAWNMDLHFEAFSTFLLSYISELIKERGLDMGPGVVLSVLTTPTDHTIISQEHIDTLKLAQRVQKGEIALSAEDPAIVEHTRKYAFLAFGCVGPAWTEKDIIDHVNEILHAGVEVHIEEQIESHEDQLKNTLREQERLYDFLNMDAQHRSVFRIAKDFMFQRGWSKEHQYMSWYTLHRILREAARRLYVSVEHIPFLLPDELREALKIGQADAELLRERNEYSLLFLDANTEQVEFVSGEEAKALKARMKIDQEEKTDIEKITELVGQTAFAGIAEGCVKIINSPKDMVKMQKGDILVSEMTIPEIVSAMKKAGAIVTDMGGITCHAAIVSRELGIPCVIGTKIATKVLKDGDRVEVDAMKGIVRRL